MAATRLTYLLTPIMPSAYMVAAVLSTVINISVSYLGYKTFVFKTRGNYLREYFRCYVVYGGVTLVNLALLPVVKNVLELFVRPPSSAPYIAGAILTVGTVAVASFIGHKRTRLRRIRRLLISRKLWLPAPSQSRRIEFLMSREVRCR